MDEDYYSRLDLYPERERGGISPIRAAEFDVLNESVRTNPNADPGLSSREKMTQKG